MADTIIRAKDESAAKQVLGVWITLSKSDKHIINQIRYEVKQLCNTLQHKLITDKQLQYVYNAVIIPRLEYRTQLTFLSKNMCHSLMVPFRTLFKHKLNFNKCISNTILHTSLLYQLHSFYNIKIQSMFTNLMCQLNDSDITGHITLIHFCQLQSYFNLSDNPLICWPFNSAILFYDPIANFSSLKAYHIMFVKQLVSFNSIYIIN